MNMALFCLGVLLFYISMRLPPQQLSITKAAGVTVFLLIICAVAISANPITWCTL